MLIDKDELEIQADFIVGRLQEYVDTGNKVFASCSFQTQSLPLLHMISRTGRDIPVYYTNTGFLFPETIAFADQLTEQLSLRVIGLHPDTAKLRQMDRQGRFLYTSDPDHCCHLNKVLPLKPLLIENDIWINGIRADQSVVRAQMAEEEKAPHGCLRYHPMLAWNAPMIYYYRKQHGLPEHPLEVQGYRSIGCEPCTRKLFDQDLERNSRWSGQNKTECGLNTTLVGNNST